jgi:hypothetical protein
MTLCYVIVEGADSLLLVKSSGGSPQRISRDDLGRALRPMVALGYEVPDIDTVSMAELAVRLSGLSPVTEGAGKSMNDKLQEIAAFASTSGGTLRGCLTIPEPTYELILRRGRESDDRSLPPTA